MIEKTVRGKAIRILSAAMLLVIILGIPGCGRTTSGTVRQNQDTKYISQYHGIDNFPMIYQNPELPKGCEITALTMVLNYYGYPVDKVQMAEQYLPVLYSPELYTGSDGKIYGNDMKRYFIGNPADKTGIICGAEAIVTAANRYLTEQGSTQKAVEMTEAQPEELYRLSEENIPVVVWCTVDMRERVADDGWYTENDEYVDWSHSDHTAVLIGWQGDDVLIADPIRGITEYSKEQFEAAFAARQNQCVILK